MSALASSPRFLKGAEHGESLRLLGNGVEVEEDGWEVDFQDSTGEKQWGELDTVGRCVRILILTCKIAAILGGLYMFIW